MNKIHLIHIGKTGGSTIKSEFENNNIDFVDIHVVKPKFNKNNKYLLVIRNPISRFISAFNWRYELLINKKLQTNRFKGEELLLKHFKNVNNLAMNINLLKRKYIHHIREDINYYLGDFLESCNSTNIIGVVLQETLNDDMKKIFNINVTKSEKVNNIDKNIVLSNIGYQKLKKYLKKDYDCIDKLYSLNLINIEQYKILSK